LLFVCYSDFRHPKDFFGSSIPRSVPLTFEVLRSDLHLQFTTIPRALRFLVDNAPNPNLSQLFTTYSDTDHSSNPDNSRSTSAYVMKMGTGPVSWMSHLQSIVTLSTTEAEFISAVSAGQEIVWLHLFLIKLGFSFDVPLLLLEDNQLAIQVAQA
jgi:hypothetical protein